MRVKLFSSKTTSTKLLTFQILEKINVLKSQQ